MPRAKQFKPETVINQAMGVFRAKGYGQATIQDVVEATGVNRASLYAQFGSKEGLFAEALTRYLRESAGKRILGAPRDLPIRELVRNALEAVISETTGDNRQICLAASATLEVIQNDPEVARRVQIHFREVEADLYARLTRAQARGDIPADKNPLALSRAILNNINGLKIVGRMIPDRATLDDIVTETLGLLD